jgi:hypothetical protein
MQKKILVRLLKLVLCNPDLDRRQRDTHIRISAHKTRVNLKTNQNEAVGPAIVSDKGVAFVRYRSLLPLIQSFRKRMLTITIDADGLHIDRFHVSKEIWWAIFDDPATAPKDWTSLQEAIKIMEDPGAGSDAPSQLVWRNNLHQSSRFDDE